MKFLLPVFLTAIAFAAACSGSVSGQGEQDAGTAEDSGFPPTDVGTGKPDVSADSGPTDTGVVDTGHELDASAVDSGPDDAGSCASGVQPQPGVVVTESGAVAGTSSGSAWAWLGIPYAEPPAGNLRWRPPQPHGCWGGKLNAEAFGNSCVQIDNQGVVSGKEDCLFLNVWAPAGYSGSADYPVMVFIHGGGHVQGTAAEQLADKSYAFDATRLSAAAGAAYNGEA